MVTGPKTDLWLVKTVGALVWVIGAALLWAGATGNLTSPVILLAVGCTVVLAAVDGVFYLQGVIARVYLLDAFA